MCKSFSNLHTLFYYADMFEDIATAFCSNDKAFIDNYKVSEYNKLIDTGYPNASVLESVGLGNDYRLSESGELDGYGKDDASKELGRFDNSGENDSERLVRVAGVGQIQSTKSDTPYTKSVHRSGVSAETLTSFGLTAEQISIRA